MPMIFRTTDLAKWGAGKGANLTPGEVDENFWELLRRLIILEENPPTPNEITSFQVNGDQFTIHMADATVFGPFTLPVAMPTWQGEWAPDTAYNFLDMFVVSGVGLFTALRTHTSEATFNPNAFNTEGSLYQTLFQLPADTTRFSAAFFVAGTPGYGVDADGSMWQFVADRLCYVPEDFEGSIGYIETAPTAALEFEVWRGFNAPPEYEFVGYIRVAAGAHVATFETATGAIQLAVGDRLHVSPQIDEEATEPVIVDTTARDLSVTLRFQLGEMPT